MSIADLEALYAAYATARADADYDTAIGCLMDMQAMLASTPNLNRSLAGGGSQAIAWNGVNLDSLISQCRRLKAEARHASVGFQRSNITYERAVAVVAAIAAYGGWETLTL